MSCEQLEQLLTDDPTITYDENTNRFAAHLRTCPRCKLGIVRLSQTLLVNDLLSCEQCRSRLPTFYEATRTDFPLVQMPERDMQEVLIHLSHCASCQEDYRFLADIAEMEERDVL